MKARISKVLLASLMGISLSHAQDSLFTLLDRNVKENSVAHTEKAFLVDGSGFIRGVYNASSPADVMRLIEDYQLLL
jgi:hypothetical protein